MKCKTNIEENEALARIINDLKIPTSAQVNALNSFLSTSSNKINAEERDLIKLILNSCSYTENLIDIFSLAFRLEFENISLNLEKFNFTGLINEIITNLNIILKYYELKIDIKAPEEEVNVYADKSLLKKILESLISNIINVSYKNSTILFSIREKSKKLIFEIKSDSPYIEPKILNEIFKKDKYYSSYFAKPSVGLTLYTAKEIAHAHFGTLSAQSYPNNVNIINLTLPVE